MYHDFYGLSESPFELTHNSRFVFYSARHRDALSHLERGLVAGSPLTLLLGGAGMGKSTLLQEALQSRRCDHIECVYLRNPTQASEPLVETLLSQLDRTRSAVSPSTAGPLQRLHNLLCERGSRGQFTALAIDEAETLSAEAFEELGPLISMLAASIQLLPIVLAGRPALGSRIDRSPLRHTLEPNTTQFELVPLELPQTAAYILWRARAAGALGGRLFTREAVAVVHHFAKGIPRWINVICDNALLTGYRRSQKPVTHHLVKDVCEQLDLIGSSAMAPARETSDVPGDAAHGFAVNEA